MVTLSLVRVRAHLFASSIVGALLAFAPGSARAEPYVGTGFGATWLTRSPAIHTDPLTLDARSVGEGKLANRGGVVMLGGYIDGGFTVADHWMVPLFGVGLASAAGSYDEVLTSYDGSLASLRPWSIYTADFFLPGLGVRAKHRRWMIAGLVRTGVSVLWEGGSLVDGAGTKTFEGQAATFLVAGQIEACRRLDPEQRLCLEFQPRLYEWGWMNGGTIGIRYEVGR